MKVKRKIYFDHAATTSLDERVFKVMKPYFSKNFGNPSSSHGFGQEAMRAVDEAREKVASFLDCEPSEVIFTSGATESNNFVLRGILKTVDKSQNHIITTMVEHPSVLETAKALEKEGCEVTYLPVSKEGIVNKESIQKAIKKNTVLVSIMYANNEIGSIQPIKEIGKTIKKINEKRVKEGTPEVHFHVDAVQAAEYLDCSTKKLRCHFLSLSGHKFYGPKGIGLLFKRKDASLMRVTTGGHQEWNMRAGTHNVPGIVGIGMAIELAKKEREKNVRKVSALKAYLIKRVTEEIVNVRINSNTSLEKGLPHIVNFSFPGAEGESILLKLDFLGIAVSTGSACSSSSLSPSHVLKAIKVPLKATHSSVRFSLGINNTREEIDYLMKYLPGIVAELRKMSPLKN